MTLVYFTGVSEALAYPFHIGTSYRVWPQFVLEKMGPRKGEYQKVWIAGNTRQVEVGGRGRSLVCHVPPHLLGYGFLILHALVTDIEPAHKVKEAMNEINAARRMRVAAAENAEAHKVHGYA